MKKSERSGANAPTNSRANKSFINVKMFEPVNKKFTISSESNSLLLDYIEYLNSSSNKKFNVDAVIEALIEKLKEDKKFKTWLSSNKSSSKHTEENVKNG